MRHWTLLTVVQPVGRGQRTELAVALANCRVYDIINGPGGDGPPIAMARSQLGHPRADRPQQTGSLTRWPARHDQPLNEVRKISG